MEKYNLIINLLSILSIYIYLHIVNTLHFPQPSRHFYHHGSRVTYQLSELLIALSMETISSVQSDTTGRVRGMCTISFQVNDFSAFVLIRILHELYGYYTYSQHLIVWVLYIQLALKLLIRYRCTVAHIAHGEGQRNNSKFKKMGLGISTIKFAL